MTFIEDNFIDTIVLARENGWILAKGTLVHGFSRGGGPINLQFGHRPDKDTMKEMIKQAKKQS